MPLSAHHLSLLESIYPSYRSFVDHQAWPGAFPYDQLQQIYNEAIGPKRFNAWCPACLVDLAQELFRSYESVRH